MRNNEEKTFTKVIIIIAIAITIVSFYFLMLSEPTKGQSANRSIGKAEIGGHFVLTDLDSNSFDSDKLKGKISLIYFGFTFCPDICPTALQKLSVLLDDLNKYNINVTPVFITIDPKRDTPIALKKYLAHFHPKLMGLTGSDEQIKTVADQFKVFYEVIPGSDKGNNDYLLDHSSLVYILDKNGEYAGHFHISTSEEEMLQYIIKNTK